MADKRSDPESVIGIDLGTTYSCVGVCRLVNGEYKVEIIANEMGNRTTPSYVSFTEDGQRLIGDPAKDQLVRNLKETVFNIKRIIGRKWTDKVVQKEIKKFPFEVIGNDLSPVVKIVTKKKKARQFSPEQISAMILKRMVKLACNFANENIKNVVITVPAYFNDAQRQATKNAGIIAGLNVLRIINEPTAAAIAYGLNSVEDEKIILVYDLGGGTFDVTILKIIQKRFTVLATCGDPYLGGEDFDQNVIDYFVKMYEMKTKTTISENHRAIQRLRKEIEKAKKVLTHSTQTSIEIDSFFEGNDFSETLTRAKFESLNMELFKSTLKSVKQALDDAKLTKENVDEIVMIGGSSRIPKIRELVKEFFDGKEPCQKINPDEAVAYGAAVQAAILTNKDSSVVLNDVNPLSLGIDVSSKMKVIIPRNTTIPVTQSTLLSTVADFQKRAKFVIYEGELPVAKDNLRIGELTLFNIQKSTAGVPHLKLTFEIDDNGILHVSAEDQVTKEKKEISISYEENRPSQEQIEEMIKISEEYDNLDDKYNQVVNLRIELGEAVYSLQQGLESMGLTERKKKQLEETIEENLQWLNDNKICEIEDMKMKKGKFDEDVKATLRSKN